MNDLSAPILSTRLARGHARQAFTQLKPHNHKRFQAICEKAFSAFSDGAFRKKPALTLQSIGKRISPIMSPKPAMMTWGADRHLCYQSQGFAGQAEYQSTDGSRTYLDDSVVACELHMVRLARAERITSGEWFVSAAISLHFMQRLIERSDIGTQELDLEISRLLRRLSSLGRSVRNLPDLKERRGVYILPWRDGAIICATTKAKLPGSDEFEWVTSARTYLTDDMLDHDHRRRIAALWDAPWDLKASDLKSWPAETWERAMMANFVPVPDHSKG